MSGQGTRFAQAGYTDPKPLVPINGISMVARLLQCFPHHWPTHFVYNTSHLATPLPQVLKTLRPDAHQASVPVEKVGPSRAVLAALGNIPEDAPVFVSYCDYGMVWDPAAFERFVAATHCDVALVSYRGFHAHYLSPQMYAYSRLVDDRVVEVREKGCFTDDREKEFASAGGYYFRTAGLLAAAIDAQQSQGLMLNDEYYTSLTVEALLRQRPSTHARVFEVPGFFQWGTPQDVRRFEFWEKTVHAHLGRPAERGQVEQVLMPMAGMGSRFNAITPLPKPLIPVGGVPMFVAALKTLPQGKRTVLVAREHVADVIQEHAASAGVPVSMVPLDATPPGQALSCEAGLPALDAQAEVLVSACDHGIVVPPAVWDRLRQDDTCDAAIFTMTGFAGAEDAPRSYSYVDADPDAPEGTFAPVRRVGVKTPLSERPSGDPVLVGTFWFRRASIMAEGIDKLKQADIRVNQELYLDSIFQLLLEAGCRVKLVPLQGYLCWGAPDALAESIYWQETLGGHGQVPRARFLEIASCANST